MLLFLLHPLIFGHITIWGSYNYWQLTQILSRKSLSSDKSTGVEILQTTFLIYQRKANFDLQYLCCIIGLALNALGPRATYLHCRSLSALLQDMAWCHIGTNPFLEPILTYNSWVGVQLCNLCVGSKSKIVLMVFHNVTQFICIAKIESQCIYICQSIYSPAKKSYAN